MKGQGFRVARKYRYYSRPYVGILVDIPQFHLAVLLVFFSRPVSIYTPLEEQSLLHGWLKGLTFAGGSAWKKTKVSSARLEDADPKP